MRRPAAQGICEDAQTRRARAAALLTLALPGAVYVYQGEELGLAEHEEIPPDALRDPMALRSGGTSPGRDGCRIPLPQEHDPASMLSLYREAIRLRRSEPALRSSALTWRHPTDSAVLSFERGPGFACVVNLAPTPAELPPHREVLLSSGPLPPEGTIPSDTAAWLRL